MKKDELSALLGVQDIGPIQMHLDALAHQRKLPALAVSMCAARMEEGRPVLRALLVKAADGTLGSENEMRLAFRGLVLLGAARDKESWPILLRLLRRPGEEIEALFGDAIHECLARVVTGMFDGDSEALFDLIADRSVDQHVRSALFGTVTYLTWEGRIAQDRMRELLQRFYDGRLAGPHDFAWVGWIEAIGLLGWRDLAPLYYRGCEEGRIADDLFDRRDFEELLAEAAEMPADTKRFEVSKLGYVDDVVDDLAQAEAVAEAGRAPFSPSLDVGWFPSEPVVNPMRHVGRNDPCPCGSGKKAKKCCLG